MILITHGGSCPGSVHVYTWTWMLSYAVMEAVDISVVGIL